MADELNNNNIFIQLKNAAGQHIFPKIDLLNTTGSLLPQSKVEGLVAALEAKLATADFNSTIANYSTTEQVTKAITDAIAGVQHFAVEVVDELPAVADAAAHTIYLVARTKGVKDLDVYDEYILIGDKFELIGNTELDLSKYYTIDEVNKAIDDDVAALKATVDAYTVNGKTIATSPVLSGADIELTGYVTEGGVAIEATDSINDAFKKIDASFKALSGDSAENLADVAGRVSTLESVTKGYTTEGEIKAAVDAKADQEAVDAVIGAEGSLTQAVAANAAAVATKAEKEYVDGIKGDLETAISGKVAQGDFDTLSGRVDTAEGEIDTLQGALEGLLSAGAVKNALDLKANKTDVDAVIGAEGTLTKAVAAKAEQSFVEEELAKKANSADLAMVVYYEVIAEA